MVALQHAMKVQDVEAVRLSRECDTSGCSREVWIVDKRIVVKYDEFGTANVREYRNMRRFKESTFTHDGETWTCKVPKVSKRGDYLLAEYIDAEEIADGPCVQCGVKDRVLWGHTRECPYGGIAHAFDRYVRVRYGLGDMHGGNFRVDRERHIIWVIDMGE